jgi:hypothetical protein
LSISLLIQVKASTELLKLGEVLVLNLSVMADTGAVVVGAVVVGAVVVGTVVVGEVVVGAVVVGAVVVGAVVVGAVVVGAVVVGEVQEMIDVKIKAMITRADTSTSNLFILFSPYYW